MLLPYRIFSNDQRVSHTAIVENKRLGHALSLIKAQQDSHFEVKIKTNSEKGDIRNVGGRYTGLTMFPKSPPSLRQWLTNRQESITSLAASRERSR